MSIPLNTSMSLRPKAAPPSAWLGHVPFAAWLVEELKPSILVELGTHNGASFLGFCQAVEENSLPTSCFAVDTWQGDEHAGHYGEDVFATLFRYQQAHYSAFSELLRMTFDDALACFADGSVDLLHIDGLHTYQAVKHDFDTWLPKISSRGVVLFHDIMVRERGFGVWRFWEEVSKRYPSFEFSHTHGLGVLLVGSEMPSSLRALVGVADGDAVVINKLFSVLGDRVRGLQKEEEMSGRLSTQEQELAAGAAAIADQSVMLGHLKQRVMDADRELAEHNSVAAQREASIAGLRNEHAVALQALEHEITAQASQRSEGEELVGHLRQRIADAERELDEHNLTTAANIATIAELRQSLSARDAQLVDGEAVIVAAAQRVVSASELRLLELAQRVEKSVVEEGGRSATLLADYLARHELQCREERDASMLRDGATLVAERERQDRAMKEVLDRQAGVVAELDRVQQELAIVHNSWSWILSRPIRWIGRLLSGGKHG